MSICGHPLVDASSCQEPVAEPGQSCAVHRLDQAAARAAMARATRRHPPPPDPPPLADDDAAAMFTYGHLWPADHDRIRAAVEATLARPPADKLRTADH